MLASDIDISDESDWNSQEADKFLAVEELCLDQVQRHLC